MKELLRSQYVRLFLSGLIVFILGAIFSIGYHWPDEHFQILEFCNYLMGKSPAKDLPWEFHAKMRPALQVYIAYAIIKLCSFAGITNPFTWAFFLRLLSAVASWFIICKLCLLLINDFVTEAGKKFFILLSLLLWFIPYLSVRFSSENFGGLALLYAIYFLLRHFKEPSRKNLSAFFISGLFLGFSFFFRFQMAFAFIGLAAWLLVIKRIHFKAIALIFSGALLSIAISILFDYFFYGTFTLTPYNYFHGNIVENRVSDAGVSPWWWYFRLFFYQGIPPLSIILLLLFFIGLYVKPKSVFSFIIIPFLLIHIIIGHKETRFLFPLAFAFLYLSAIGIDFLLTKNKIHKLVKYSFCVIAFINIPILAYRTLSPAQEAMAYYRFLYNYAANDSTTIICKDKSIYNLVGVEVNFYKSPNVHVITLKNDSAILYYVQHSNVNRKLFFSENLDADSTINKYVKQRAYCLFPEWLLKYNINNWETRARIWSIYEMSTR